MATQTQDLEVDVPTLEVDVPLLEESDADFSNVVSDSSSAEPYGRMRQLTPYSDSNPLSDTPYEPDLLTRVLSSDLFQGAAAPKSAGDVLNLLIPTGIEQAVGMIPRGIHKLRGVTKAADNAISDIPSPRLDLPDELPIIKAPVDDLDLPLNSVPEIKAPIPEPLPIQPKIIDPIAPSIQSSAIPELDVPVLRGEVIDVAEASPLVKSVINTALESGDPAITAAATSPEFIKKFIEPMTRNTPSKRVVASISSSIDTELTKQSPILGEVVKKVQADSAIKSGTWTVEFDNATGSLTDNEFSRLVDAIEGKVKLDPITDAKVIKAKSRYEVLDAEVSKHATESGMGLRSSDGVKTVPWQPRENYWPHLYTQEFFESLKNNPTAIRDAMAKNGLAPLEIDSILANSKRFGERLVDAQHGREANLPGYRVDRNVYREHLDDMARRITESHYYGPMDLADDFSPLSQLVKETNNPDYTANLMKKLLGRDVQGDRDVSHLARQTMTAQAWLHLGTAGISNLGSTFMPLTQASTSSFVRGLTEAVFNAQKSGEFAQAAGAYKNIFREIFAQTASGHSWSPTKVYGMDAGEKFMRQISAATGKSYAGELFNEVKANPANTKAAQQLRNLILEDPTIVIKQPELNDLQIKRAAFRVAELSNGLAEKQNLPAAWTGSGLANLLTLFHKYQFAQTKIIKDAIRTNPVKALAVLIPMSQIVGELTGDAKAVVRGSIKAGVSGDSSRISEEIANRPKWLANRFGLDEDGLAARMAENAAQSFALGVYADVIEAMGGTGAQALVQLAGSTVGDLIKLFDISKNAAIGAAEVSGLRDVPENRRESTMSPLGKAAVGVTSFIPIVGGPIAGELKNPQ